MVVFRDNSKTWLYRIIFLSTDIRRNSTGHTEIYCSDMAVVNGTQLGESSFIYVRGSLCLFTFREKESTSLK